MKEKRIWNQLIRRMLLIFLSILLIGTVFNSKESQAVETTVTPYTYFYNFTNSYGAYFFYYNNNKANVAYCLNENLKMPYSSMTYSKIEVADETEDKILNILNKSYNALSLEKFNELSGFNATEEEYRAATQQAVWCVMGYPITIPNAKILQMRNWIIKFNWSVPELSIEDESEDVKTELPYDATEVIYGPYRIKITDTLDLVADITDITSSETVTILDERKNVLEDTTNLNSGFVFYVKVSNENGLKDGSFSLKIKSAYKTAEATFYAASGDYKYTYYDTSNVTYEKTDKTYQYTVTSKDGNIVTKTGYVYSSSGGSSTLKTGTINKDEFQIFFIPQEIENEIEYKISNSWEVEKVGDLEINKVDQSGNKVKNAKFNIWYDVNNNGVIEEDVDSKITTGTLDGTYLTDENGKIQIKNLVPGQYLIQEIDVPDAYVLNTKVITLNVEAGKRVSTENPNSITIENIKKAEIKIKKVDSTDDSLLLSGIKFKIKNLNTNEEITRTTADGYINVELAEGKYQIEEIETIYGYQLDTTKRVINIVYDSENKQYTFTIDNSETKTGKEISLEFTNTPIIGYLQINKTDSVTNENIKNRAIKFELTKVEYNNETNTYEPCEVYTSGTVKKYSISTDFTGVTSKIKLTVGKYKIKEITDLENYEELVNITSNQINPEGPYQDSDGSTYFIIDILSEQDTKSKGGYISISAQNKPYGKLEFTKVDSVNGTFLNGGKFKIYKADGTTTISKEVEKYIVEQGEDLGNGEFTTKNGKIIISLPEGTYYIEETEYPDGYGATEANALGQKHEFIVKAGGVSNDSLKTKVSLTNKPLQRPVKIVKKDTLGNPIEEVKFRIYKTFETDSEGNVTKTNCLPGELISVNGKTEFTTDENGEINLTLIGGANIPNYYRIEEVYSPVGYTAYDYDLCYDLAEKFFTLHNNQSTRINNGKGYDDCFSYRVLSEEEFWNGYDITFTYDELVAFLITKTNINTLVSDNEMNENNTIYKNFIYELTNIKTELYTDLLNNNDEGNIIMGLMADDDASTYTFEIINSVAPVTIIEVNKLDNDTNERLNGAEFVVSYTNNKGEKYISDVAKTEDGKLTLNINEYNNWLDTLKGKISENEETRVEDLRMTFDLYEVSNAGGYALPGELVKISNDLTGVLVGTLTINREEELEVEFTSKVDSSVKEAECIGTTENVISLNVYNKEQDKTGKFYLKKYNKSTGYGLANAVFTLQDANGEWAKDKDGNTIGKITTGENGEIAKYEIKYKDTSDYVEVEPETVSGKPVIGNLLVGKYYLKEEIAPVGYEPVEKQVVIIQDETVGITICQVANKEYESKLKITKKDSKTGEVVNVIDGAEFEITKYGDSSFKQTVKMTSNEPIEIALAPGNYIVKETKAPFGYKITEEEKSITIDQEDTLVEIEFFDDIDYTQRSIKIFKKIANYTPDKYISGAEVQIKKVALENGVETLVDAVDIDGNVYNTFVTSEDGVEIKNLLLGVYEITELSAPSGFIKLDTTIRIKLEENEYVEYQKIDDEWVEHARLSYSEDSYKNATIARVEIENEYKNNVSLEIRKILSDGTSVKEATYKQGESIKNTKFKIYKVEETVSEIPNKENWAEGDYYFEVDNGSKYKCTIGKDIFNSEIDTIVVDEEGIAKVNNIPSGNYIIEEISNPTGYATDSVVFVEATGEENSAYIAYVTNDVLYGSIKIIKKDEDTNEFLKNAKFVITDENGNIIEEDIFGNKIGKSYSFDSNWKLQEVSENADYNGVLSTDENGEIIVNYLPIGEYIIKELEAPEGYAEDIYIGHVKVESSKTCAIEISNRIETCEVTIEKFEGDRYDDSSKLYIEGVEFYLEELNINAELKNIIISKDGTKLFEEDSKELKVLKALVKEYNDISSNSNLTSEEIDTEEKAKGAEIKNYVLNYLANNNLTTDIITNSSGKVTVQNLSCNSIYRFVETKTTERYILPEYNQNIVKILNKDASKTISIENTAKTELVRIFKYEEDQKSILVAGARFVIVPVNAEEDDVKNAVALVTEQDVSEVDISWFTNNTNRNINDTNTNPKTILNFESVDGMVELEVPIGNYIVKELQAPEGYYIPQNDAGTFISVQTPSSMNVTEEKVVSDNGTVKIEVVKDTSSDELITEITMFIENIVAKGDAEFIKVDEDGATLDGAVFKVYRDENKNGKLDESETLMQTVTSTTSWGSGGLITLSNLPVGQYILKEVEAPIGLGISGEYVFVITAGEKTTTLYKSGDENKTLLSQIENKKIRVPIQIIKRDEVSNIPLAGAIFEIYNSNNELVLTTSATNEEGIVEFELPYGEYYAKEIEAPKGYYLDNTTIEIDLTQELTKEENKSDEYPNGYVNSIPEGYKVTITATNILDGGNIKIIKTDGVNTTQNLTGAKFDLYACEVTELTEIPEASIWEEGITYALTTNDKVVKYKAQEKIAEITDDKTAGEYEFNNVPKGNYILIETKAPEGYLLETAPNLIEVKGAKIGSNNTIVQETVEVPITNVKGKIKLIKYEDGTTYTISNVKFKAYKQQDTNGVIDEAEKENAIEIVTDKNGTAEVSLDKGLYILEEIEAPKGYVLSGQKYIFNLNEQTKEAVLYELTADDIENSTIAGKVYLGETSDLTSISVARDENGNNIINNKLQDIKVTLKKVNLEGDPLAGASFKIYKALRDSNGNYREGTYVKENNTYYLKYLDENQEEKTEEITLDLVEETEKSSLLAGKEGIIELSEKIPYGKYIIEEVNVPKNYARIDDLIVIDLTEKTENIEVQSFTIENTLQLGSFEIKKYEGANGVSTQVVSGAEFKIYKATGSVEENVLDEEGNETGEKITKYTYSTEPENVTIKEASAIPGTYYCEGVTAGRYILKETVTPNGYIACEPIEFEIVTIGDYDKETKAEILILGETETTNTIKVTNDLRVGSLKITKISDVTKEPVAGVRFEVVATDLEKGTIIVSKVTDPTSTDGVTIIENLPIGIYTIKEIEETVMDGYYVAEDVTGVVVEDSQNAEGNTYTPLITSQTIENKKQVRDIKIIKKDQFDKTISGGATFELYKLDSDGNRVKVTTDAYGNEITNFTTDENGVLEIKNLQSSVAGENYILKEIEAPFGYIKDGIGEKEIKLKHENQTEEITEVLTIEFTNEKIIFDLGLEKWVSKVSTTDGEEISYDDRNTLDAGVEGREGDIEVTKGDIVTYTIRVFNHGNIDAYATKILDTLPEGLEMVEPTYDEEGNATNLNALYGWKIDENTLKLYTNYLEDKIITKHIGTNGNTAHKGLNYSTSEEATIANACDNCAYQEVKLEVRVTDCYDKIVNIAQIAETKTPYDKENQKIEDIDSIPDSYKDSDYREEEGKSREDDEDIAVIVPRRFGLELKKWISNYTVIVGKDSKEYVTTQTAETSDKEKSEEKIVKIDIKSNKVNKTDVIINYNMRVTNNGDLEGYVDEITDYIPQGLEFVQEDNISETGEEYWTLNGTDQIVTGEAYNQILENTLLQPGEYIEVSVKLRWVQDVENFGLITNYAEISKDRNIYNVKDYNSTPSNFVETTDEDDTDKVPVYLAVETGEYMIKYYIIIGGLMTVLFALVAMKRLMRKYSGSF